MAADPLLGIAEELYALPPGRFTADRHRWARQTRAGGDAGLAKRVSRLRRPSLAAWVVNMMVRHDAEHMTQLLDLGASLRRAQADLDADALRELTRQRRQLTAAVTRQGRALAVDLGQSVSAAVADQVQATLHAAMVDEDAAAAVRSGLLVTALTATGVGGAEIAGAVAVPAAVGMTPRPHHPRPRRRAAELSVVPEPEPASGAAQQDRDAAREAERQAAQEAVEQAVATTDEARRRLRKAGRRVEKVQARTLQAAEELEEAKGRVAQREHDLDTLDDEAVAAQEKKERAEARYAEAQERLDRARADLAGLD